VGYRLLPTRTSTSAATTASARPARTLGRATPALPQSALWPWRPANSSPVHPGLIIIRRQAFSLFDFQLAGGFKPYAFIKLPADEWFLPVDQRLDMARPLAGFRILCIIERGSRAMICGVFTMAAVTGRSASSSHIPTQRTVLNRRITGPCLSPPAGRDQM